MASTTALFTGLSGLTANSRNLDIIGNNIANANTTAFKSNRMLFASTFSRTFSLGSVPGANTGGTNPGQVGLGVSVAGTQRDFRNGAISPTGDQRDLAIEGDGFFVVNRGPQTFYTRAGAFRQNSQNDLVTISGERVMGFGVDDNFNVVPGRLVPLNIPVGSLTLAEATRNVQFSGNLNAGGNVPTQGSLTVLDPLMTQDTGLGSNPAAGTTLLVGLGSPENPAVQRFTTGQFIELSGAQKGNKTLPTARFEITGTSTVDDLMAFLRDALGINTTTGANPDGSDPDVTINATTGVISIVGNTGTVNDINIRPADIRLLNSGGTLVGQAFLPTKTGPADGESVRTSFTVYDSLGTPLSVDLTMVLDSKSNAGNVWRYYLEAGGETNGPRQLGTGLVRFDTSGQLQGESIISAQLDRSGSGAVDPLVFDLSFTNDAGRVTSLTNPQGSVLESIFQDGSALGTLASYSVGTDGIITGAFSNGLTRTVGQVAMAKFTNPEGLVDVGNNLFGVGPNSGTPIVTAPTVLGTGRVIGGALELSNVELSQEFINLILATTGFSAASRVITSTDQLMQQLLVLGR